MSWSPEARTLTPIAPASPARSPPDAPQGAGVAQRALAAWSFCTGVALWAPALSLPYLPLPLQPMDGLVITGWPLLLLRLAQLPWGLLPVLGTGLLSLGLSWLLNGGQALILAWTVGFALPFVALTALVAADPLARSRLLLGLMLGAATSALLFCAQIWLGAEALDFRSNLAFRLPSQYGRAFALMPEVSTYAVHAVLSVAMFTTLILHGVRSRRRLLVLALLLLVTLAFTRSTSVIVLLPLLFTLALARSRRADAQAMMLSFAASLILLLLMAGFLQLFYAERLQSASASRSAAMRLASVLGGLSPLERGELFGLGIGENALVRLRAHEAARAFGLRFGSLPDGINSQIIGRLFEEGWPALLHLSVATILLARLWRSGQGDPAISALLVLAWGSFLAALLVVGYRGIYTNWLWLGLAAGLPAAPSRARKLG
jgi:hypothetical protein